MPAKGQSQTPEAKEKIAAANRGRKHTPETRRKMAAAHTGKKRTPEHRANLSKALKGKKRTPEQRKRISEANSGRVMSDETKRKIAEARRGQKHSEETIRKIREANRGRVFTPEHRRNIAAAQRRRVYTDAERQRFSEVHTGRKHTEETKRKISEKLQGHDTSDATKRKISEARLRSARRKWKRKGLDIEAITAYYQAGNTLVACSKKFGVAYTTVRCVLLDNGITLRTRAEAHLLRQEKERADADAGKHAELVSLYESGLSVRQIAEKVGLSQPTVRKRLRISGIEPPSLKGKHKRKPLDAGKHAELVSLHETGLSVRQIAEKVGLSQPTVRKRLRISGIEPPSLKGKHKRKPLDVPVTEIVKLYRDKRKSLAEIANRYDISPTTVTRILQGQGVKRRTPADARKEKKEKTPSPVDSQIQKQGDQITVNPVEKWVEPITVNRSDNIFEMRKAGLKINDIAEIKGMTPVEVYYELKSKGVS